ncbi:hypothetical protein RQCS_38490 [Rhodococcus qingshengii]|nr:hypothetical protein RQCS_38490 [Rhodococcus qingshengii]
MASDIRPPLSCDWCHKVNVRPVFVSLFPVNAHKQEGSHSPDPDRLGRRYQGGPRWRARPPPDRMEPTIAGVRVFTGARHARKVAPK